MALPASGTISINNINVEQGLSGTTTNSAMRTRASQWGFSSPDAMSDWYSKKWSTIACTYGGVTTVTNTSTAYTAYRSITRTGHNAPDTIRPRIRFSFTLISGTCTMYLDWSLNSTSSWTNFAMTSSIYTSIWKYINIPTSGSCDYNDVLRLRVRLVHSSSAWATGYSDLNGGSFVSGSGIITGTAGWNWSA